MTSRPLARPLVMLAALASIMATGCKNADAPELSQPATLTLVSGDAQVANGTVLPTPLVVQVTDVKGRGISGIAINWVSSDSTAILSATTSTTDNDGRAQIVWTLGATAGRQTVTARTTALPGSQVVFQANNGGVISGGVTIQSAPPVAFAALSRTSPIGASLLRDRIVNQPSLSASRIAPSARATRRLIVTFKETAGMMRTAQAGATARANSTRMQRALAVHAAAHRVSRFEISPAILSARVTVPAGQSMDAAVAALRADATVASVTEDQIVPLLQPYSATPAAEARVQLATDIATQSIGGALAGPLPNDPYIFNALWHYNLVDAPRAWTRTTGSASVLVAVVDNGTRYDHPALGPAGASNLTHDGYNFVQGGDLLADTEAVCAPSGPLGATTTLHENGPSADPTQPDDLSWDGFNGCWMRSTVGNHGLHVAGTIGAVGNDGLGVAGLNWKVQIRPVRVLDITGSGSYFDVAQGILYAAGLPAAADTITVQAPSRAAVINMSLGGPLPSTSTLHDAVIAATNAGSLIVASAGNSESSSPSYPASFPEVLSVSAVGPDLTLSSYSNIGGNVAVAAPGGNFRSNGGTSGVISSTWNYVTGAPSYAYYQGTSMAAPHVTGVAALVLAVTPGLTAAQLRDRITSTAVHIGAPGRNDQYGYGLVNAYNAVTNSTGPTRATYVRIVDAATGALASQVAVGADGSFSASRLRPGSYYVYAGQDENGDQMIGVPARRFGWYGPAGGPTQVTITTGGNVSASVNIGTPLEAKVAHGSPTAASRLTVNSYMLGQITPTDGPDFYSVLIPVKGTYYFEVAGVLGTCGLGLELNAKLDLVDVNGNSLVSAPASCNVYYGTSGVRAQLGVANIPAGTTLYLKVSGATATSSGQYHVWVRDTP